jgi:tetratricopeptide (TPR) repeat protein
MGLERRFAIIIGTNCYTSVEYQLQFSLKDAVDVSNVLQEYCEFKTDDISVITSDINTNGKIEKEIQKAFEKIKNNGFIKGMHTFLFYYSGHGVYNSQKEKSYLELSDNEQISIQSLFNSIKELEAKNSYVIIDACHSGGQVNLEGSSKGGKQSRKLHYNSEGIYCLFSSTHNQKSFEPNLIQTHKNNIRNGFLTHYFIEIIKSQEKYTKGYLGFGSIQEYIKINSQLVTNFRQIPITQTTNTKGFHPFAIWNNKIEDKIDLANPQEKTNAKDKNRRNVVVLLMILIIITILIIFFIKTNFKDKSGEVETQKVSLGCDFPKKFNGDSLYILITGFEDDSKRFKADCHGTSINRRIDFIKNEKKLPIKICYEPNLSPKQSDEVKLIQKNYNADLVLWGNLKNLSKNCGEGDICFKSQPSDSIIRICSGEIETENYKLEYEKGMRSEDIEEGNLHVGNLAFDSWILAVFNAKIGKKKPSLFRVDTLLSKEKQAELWMQKGNLFYNLGNYTQSINCFTESIQLEPNHSEFYNNRGIARKKIKDYAGAISDYDKVIELYPSYGSAYYNRAILKREMKDYKNAISDYNKAIMLDSSQATFYYNRANLKIEMKDYKDAISDYDKAIKLDSNQAIFYINRGVIKKILKDYNGATIDFEKAIQIDSNEIKSYINLGDLRKELKDFNGAKSYYNKAIEIDTISDALTYADRGISKAGTKDINGALSDFNNAIQFNPNNKDFYYNRAILKRDIGDYKGSIIDFDKAIELNPYDALYYNNRGISKIETFDTIGALNDYEKAIQLDKNYVRAYNNLGDLKRSKHDYINAIKDFETAIQIDSNNPMSYFFRGKTKSDKEDFEGAKSDFQKAIQLNPNFKEASKELEIVNNKIGKIYKNEKNLEKSATMDNRSKIVKWYEKLGIGALFIMIFYFLVKGLERYLLKTSIWIFIKSKLNVKK